MYVIFVNTRSIEKCLCPDDDRDVLSSPLLSSNYDAVRRQRIARGTARNGDDEHGTARGPYNLKVRVVGDDGREECIRLEGGLRSLLDRVGSRAEKFDRDDEEAMRGSCVQDCELEIPESLWSRVRASPSDSTAVIRRATNGYMRNKMSLEDLLGVLDQVSDSKSASDFVSLLPMKQFVAMARENRRVETNGGNALQWVLRRRSDAVAVEDIDAIIEVLPDAAEQTAKNGSRALHMAALRASQEAVAAGGEVFVDILERLMEVSPDGVKYQDEQGFLPLHVALQPIQPCTKVVQILVQAYPDGVKVATKSGLTALHIAARISNPEIVDLLLCHGNGEDGAKVREAKLGTIPLFHALDCGYSNSLTIKRLLEAFPESPKEMDRDGRTPLHCAVTKQDGVGLENIRLIHQGWPDAVRIRDARGLTPLHIAMEAGASMDIVSFLLEQSPSSTCAETCGNNSSLLHLLMRNPKVSVDVARRLYEGRPEAIEQRDREGLLPLHTALMSGVDIGVVKFLVEEFPESVHERTKLGSTALHCALARKIKCSVIEHPEVHELQEKDNKDEGRSTNNLVDGRREEEETAGEIDLAVVQYIHSLVPNHIRARTPSLGHTPLLRALLSGAPEEVISYLRTSYLQGFSIPSSRGMNTLHAAILGRASVRVVKLILENLTGAATQRDEGGLTPLHFALMNGGPWEVIDAILHVDPGAARIKTLKPSLTPLQLAMVYKADSVVLRRLLAAWPGAKSVQDDESNHPRRYVALYGPDERRAIREHFAFGTTRGSASGGRGGAGRIAGGRGGRGGRGGGGRTKGGGCGRGGGGRTKGGGCGQTTKGGHNGSF